MNSTRTRLVVLLFVIGLVLTGSACASKKYVRTQVDARVTPLEGRTGELEESSRNLSNRTTELEGTTSSMKGQISELDRGVTEARTRADEAITAANDANNRVSTVDERVSNLDVWKLHETQAVLFKVGSSRLTPEGKTMLDEFAARVKDSSGYLIEVQGFTDATGSDSLNRRLSEARARAVFQYLAEKDIPIHKMQIVGFGEARPVAENTTRQGRKENRRVEVRLLSNAAIGKGITASTPNPSDNVRATTPDQQ